MTISDIAKKYHAKPQVVYSIIRDFEHVGILELARIGRRLQLDRESREIVEAELQRRGYQ